MGLKFTKLNSWFTLVLLAVAVNLALAKGIKVHKTDTSYLHLLSAISNRKANTDSIEQNSRIFFNKLDLNNHQTEWSHN